MLIRKATLDQIKLGAVTLVFRRWSKPTVKSGGQLKTAVGVLAIESVDKVTLKSITVEQANEAGYEKLNALLDELRQRDGGVYKIRLSYFGEDPRLQLRESDDISEEELHQIQERLAKYDARSSQGEWTLRVLIAIDEHPQQSAKALAPLLGYEKPWFKANVRKLKEMGLTVSQRVGYTLSPRGKLVLQYLKKSQG